VLKELGFESLLDKQQRERDKERKEKEIETKAKVSADKEKKAVKENSVRNDISEEDFFNTLGSEKDDKSNSNSAGEWILLLFVVFAFYFIVIFVLLCKVCTTVHTYINACVYCMVLVVSEYFVRELCGLIYGVHVI